MADTANELAGYLHSPTVILPQHIVALQDSSQPFNTGRTLCLLFDGTGDKFDGDNTNVVHLLSAIKKGDPSQLVYYQTGIGTSDSKNGVKKGFSGIIDMAVGSGLGFHVRQGYTFLQQNYKEGDRINLFGFSRGAYTARALAGMLYKCGLLPRDNPELVDFAYEMYKRSDAESASMAHSFKKTFSIDVAIHFLGVWDTVASVGGLIPRTLPFTASNNGGINTFRHALSLDEHRAKFKANHFMKHVDDPDKERTSLSAKADEKGLGGPLAATVAKMALEQPAADEHGRRNQARRLSSISIPSEDFNTFPKGSESGKSASVMIKPISEGKFLTESGKVVTSHSNEKEKKTEPVAKSASALSRMTSHMSEHSTTPTVIHEHRHDVAETEFVALSEKPIIKTDVLECWFLGAHCDVGGGAVPNDTRQALANIPLRWMVRETFKCNTGIIYDSSTLNSFRLDMDSLYPRVAVRTPPLFTGPSPGLFDTLSRTGMATESRLTMKATDLRGDVPNLGEYVEDYFDSLSKINDQLNLSKSWWILELLPIKRFSQDRNGSWSKRFLPNLGRYRTIRDSHPNLHWTVLNRHEEGKYKILNEVDHDAKFNVIY